jgi:hypothetical protein
MTSCVLSKPFAMRLFEAVKDDGPMNTLHVQGIILIRTMCSIFRSASSVGKTVYQTIHRCKRMKDRFAGCVMGGIDNTVVTRHTPEYLMDMVREAWQWAEQRAFSWQTGAVTIPGP